MEFPLQHDPAHLAAAANKQAIEDLVHDIAERAGAANSEALACELCLIIEGAYVTRQVTGRPESVVIARRLAEGVLGKHLPRERSGAMA